MILHSLLSQSPASLPLVVCPKATSAAKWLFSIQHLAFTIILLPAPPLSCRAVGTKADPAIFNHKCLFNYKSVLIGLYIFFQMCDNTENF